MRILVGVILLSLSLTSCSSTLDDREAKAVCAKWIEKSRPGYEVRLREPVVAEEDRLVTIGGEAVKGKETASIQCAVDIQSGKVVGGFN